MKMQNIKKIISALLAALIITLCAAALPVFAAETTAEDTAAADTTAAGGTSAAEETTVADETTAAKEAKPVSDLSNIIGIVVAVVLGAGAVVAIVLLIPKNTAPKKK